MYTADASSILKTKLHLQNSEVESFAPVFATISSSNTLKQIAALRGVLFLFPIPLDLLLAESNATTVPREFKAYFSRAPYLNSAGKLGNFGRRLEKRLNTAVLKFVNSRDFERFL